MSDAVLVLNAGSSSLKFSVFDAGDLPRMDSPRMVLRGQIEGIFTSPRFIARDADGRTIGEHSWPAAIDHPRAVEFLISWAREHGQGRSIVAAGHRVVHGGAAFDRPVRINAEVLSALRALIPLAPLHQPHNLAAIEALARLAPDLPQVACFDTAFHHTQPAVAQALALPRRLTDSGLRRYGFHGLSYEYIAGILPSIDASAAAGGAIIAHLGNGASLCALRAGRSIATTMGFTALDGLVMGTRCGSLDPGVALYLLRQGWTADRLEHLLYEESGLLGVSGLSGDMRTLLASDQAQAREAIELFVYRVAREIGSLAAALGSSGVDAIVFTGGIGENAVPIRAAICRASAWLGVDLDEHANERGGPRITRPGSRTAAWVIPTNEELIIARHTAALLAVSPT